MSLVHGILLIYYSRRMGKSGLNQWWTRSRCTGWFWVVLNFAHNQDLVDNHTTTRYGFGVRIKASAHYKNSAVVQLCISQAVVWADTAHYTSRMPSPATGTCVLYFLPYQPCDRSPRPIVKTWFCQILTTGPTSQLHNWKTCAHGDVTHYITIPVAELCNRELCSVQRPTTVVQYQTIKLHIPLIILTLYNFPQHLLPCQLLSSFRWTLHHSLQLGYSES